ncbi:vascular endothelial growth factor A-A [Silurus meridionalis]|uniref:Platelet-derived growth factor (PDGF) family profile domain-containing protein n=1 Tax=Silurus meridionalis TaxID=175797 RepID=A0A8T0AX25_SILME|nr:vascular endothelial growth factor A-A [Silurus meridionalis]KAF7697251.1 hypothetical protein HF521_005669 [Silurus meridionalis]
MSISHLKDLDQHVGSFDLHLVIMSHVFLWLLLVITPSLQTRGPDSQDYNEDTGEKLKPNKGITTSDLILQSSCKPRETLINVYEEFPNETQYTIVPSCVPMQRCLGCCTDEATVCTPRKTKTVKLEVIRVYSDGTQQTIKLNFRNHTHCSCRYRFLE